MNKINTNIQAYKYPIVIITLALLAVSILADFVLPHLYEMWIALGSDVSITPLNILALAFFAGIIAFLCPRLKRHYYRFETKQTIKVLSSL